MPDDTDEDAIRFAYLALNMTGGRVPRSDAEWEAVKNRKVTVRTVPVFRGETIVGYRQVLDYQSLDEPDAG